MTAQPRIVVIGLGYVGLPLAVALARKFEVIGLDSDQGRIDELARNHDRTHEIESEVLADSTLRRTSSSDDCHGADIYIIAVPTPVDRHHRPDLSALRSATRTVAGLLDPGKCTTIVYESTVYPGLTDDFCGPEIERVSGLTRGVEFKLGYSPERITPADREHSIDKIIKVVAGEDEDVTRLLEEIYGSITTGGTFRAASIKTAEAAKAIENAQRDINIAFINEVAQIFSRVDVSIWDVLAAAKTKWNFLPFEPGLVGGHCIGVDPYYLSHLAERFGHHPQVILAGRGINDAMGVWVADALHEHRSSRLGSVLVLGLTFKENVTDLRNSRVGDVISRLTWLGHTVDVADPLADNEDVKRAFGLELTELDGRKYDLVIGAVAHDHYRRLDAAQLEAVVARGGTLADLKGIWRSVELDPAIDRWSL